MSMKKLQQLFFFPPVFGEQKLSHHKTMGPYYLYNGFTQKKKKKSIMRQLATVLAFVLNVTEGDVFKQWLPGSLSPLLG